MALRERNESIVAGCNMTKGSIASVDAHMFNHNEVASSTLRHDQLVRKSQCENLTIFLPLRFYVKSFLSSFRELQPQVAAEVSKLFHH